MNSSRELIFSKPGPRPSDFALRVHRFREKRLILLRYARFHFLHFSPDYTRLNVFFAGFLGPLTARASGELQ